MGCLRTVRLSSFCLALWSLAWGGLSIACAQEGGSACTRDGLKGVVDQYLAALAAHNPSGVPLDGKVRFTENGTDTQVGKGLWATAGKVLLKRSAIDTGTCGTVTQAIIEENNRPTIFGFRLKLKSGKITETEHIIVREKEFAFTPKGILDTAAQDWEGLLKPAERSSRMAMTAAAVDCFDMFADDPVVNTPFASPCDRWENGMQTTKGGEFQGKVYPPHSCTPKGLGLIMTHPPRRVPVVDLEAGIAVAFVHFAKSLPDFHMFKIRNGKVELIQAVIGAAAPSTGWASEEVLKN
jgi:hypothetical protein